MTDKLKQAAQHLLKVLDEICADDYIQEVIDAHLEKYGDHYRSERVTRYRDEKLSYLSAVAELEAALAAPHYPLPDSLYPGSKDWMAGDYAERVEWLHRMYESKKRELDDLYAQMAAPQGEPVDALTQYLRDKREGDRYGPKQIGWELERTAMGDSYYGNALRTAKDFPCVTDEDRIVLDRWATGAQASTDHIRLQEIAIKVYAFEWGAAPQPAAPQAQQVKSCATCKHDSKPGAPQCYACNIPAVNWEPK